MRLLDLGAPLRRNSLLGFGFALATFIVAFGARVLLDPTLATIAPFVTFIPAVLLTAVAAGPRPAILNAALGGLAGWYFFLGPVPGFTMSTGVVVAVFLFYVNSGLVIALVDALQRLVERLRAEKGVSAALYDRERTMFQELQHRVANNMAFVASLLTLQKRKVAAEPAMAGAAFDGALDRIGTMARVHRRLYDPDAASGPCENYFRGLCDEVLAATGASHIVCTVTMIPLVFDIGRLLPMSLFVTEVVTNSIKHAFTGRDDGRITVDLARFDDEKLVLTIRDDGQGLPPGPAVAIGAGAGLGTRILTGLAAQLGGTLTVRSNGGVETRLVFPGKIAPEGLATP